MKFPFYVLPGQKNYILPARITFTIKFMSYFMDLIWRNRKIAKSYNKFVFSSIFTITHILELYIRNAIDVRLSVGFYRKLFIISIQSYSFWILTHASRPFTLLINNKEYRLFFRCWMNRIEFELLDIKWKWDIIKVSSLEMIKCDGFLESNTRNEFHQVFFIFTLDLFKAKTII